jgi:hypothetical protein
VSKKSTSKESEARKLIKSDLARIDAMTDEDIDYSDIPPTTGDFWKNARVLTGASRRAADLANTAEVPARSSIGQTGDESSSTAIDVPRSESERRVWAILEKAKASTISIVNSEKEGELVSEDLLTSRIRTCR